MGRNNKDFRSAQISDSRQLSEAIRMGWTGGYSKGLPAKYTSEEGFQEATPKVKGLKQKRIRQAKGKE